MVDPTDAPVNVRQVIQKLYGINAYSQGTARTTGGAGTVTAAFRNNSTRVALLVFNLSVNVMFISPDPAPSAANGIRLDPNGGRLLLNFKDDLELCGYEWNIFDAVGGSAFYILETFLLGKTAG